MRSIESFAKQKLAIKRPRIRQFLAEFLGSFILALTGIAANHVGRYFGPISSVHGAIAGGLGVALGIFASAGASGGHINPAVTMGHLVLGRMGDGFLSNIWGACVYWAAQVLGMLLAAACDYFVYYSQVTAEFENATDEIKYGITCLYATCPSETSNLGSMFFDEVLGAGVLVTTVFSTTDPFNANPPGMAPLLIGLSATAMGLAFGPNSGGAINSARDLGPRLFASMAFGPIAFTGISSAPNSVGYMWTPLFGPLVGGACAAIIYLFLVMAHWPQNRTSRVYPRNDENEPDTEENNL